MYLRRCDEQAIISRSPRLPLIGGVLLAVGLCLICYALYYLSSFNFDNPATWIFLVMGIAGFGVGYRASSPFLLSIDRTKRTYRGYRNWFPFRQQLAGGWEDFDHLSVKFYRGETSTSGTWTVELNWRDTAKEPFTLYLADGRTVGLEAAQRRGVVLPERLDKAQAAALASSPLRFFVNDKQLEAHHQGLVLASLLNLPLVAEELKT